MLVFVSNHFSKIDINYSSDVKVIPMQRLNYYQIKVVSGLRQENSIIKTARLRSLTARRFVKYFSAQRSTQTAAHSLLMLQYFPKPNLIPDCLILHMKGPVMISIYYVRVE